MSRTGAEYIESLRDARAVFVGGERVVDVTEHGAFRAAVRSIAQLYDLAADPAHRDVMTFPSPATGLPVNMCFLMPETAADLERFVRSPGLRSVERVKLYKLAWDLVGSEFAGRHQQYELFYAGGRAQTTSIRAYRSFDFGSARAMVERCLAGYDAPVPPAGEHGLTP